MARITVYDKISWHFPEGKDCPSLESAIKHFKTIMNWLKDNNLLSDEGNEIYEIGIDADFSITSSMLNKKGNDIFKEYYFKWLKTIEYSESIDLKSLDDGLSKYKNS